MPEIAETTALGAAYLAGVGIGLWTIDQVRAAGARQRRYEPAMSADERETLLHHWRRALERARDWERGVGLRVMADPRTQRSTSI